MIVKDSQSNTENTDTIQLLKVLEKYQDDIINNLCDNQDWRTAFFENPAKSIIETFKVTDSEKQDILMLFANIQERAPESQEKDIECKTIDNSKETYADINIDLIEIKKIVMLISIMACKDKKLVFDGDDDTNQRWRHELEFSYIQPEYDFQNELVLNFGVKKGIRTQLFSVDGIMQNGVTFDFSTATFQLYPNFEGIFLTVEPAEGNCHDIKVKNDRFVKAVVFTYWESPFGDKTSTQSSAKDGLNSIYVEPATIYKTDVFVNYKVPASLIPQLILLTKSQGSIIVKAGANKMDHSYVKREGESLLVYSYIPLTLAKPYVRELFKLKNESDLFVENNSLKNAIEFDYDLKVHNRFSIFPHIKQLDISFVDNGISFYTGGKFTILDFDVLKFQLQITILFESNITVVDPVVPDFQELSVILKQVNIKFSSTHIGEWIYNYFEVEKVIRAMLDEQIKKSLDSVNKALKENHWNYGGYLKIDSLGCRRQGMDIKFKILMRT